MATKMNPPGHEYLVMDRPVVDLQDGVVQTKISDKCEHNQGQWVVEWKGKFYFFIHSNNLQKDIWLSGAKNDKDKDACMNMLRWYCNLCCNVQKP